MEKTLKTAGKAAAPGLSFPRLFRLVLDDIGLKASTVALELRRERTLMYKWLSGSSIPPASYAPLIVQIVTRHASQAKRWILTRDLQELVRDAELPVELRDSLLRIEPVEELLAECLDLSLTPTFAGGAPRAPGGEAWKRWSVLLGALFAAVFGGILWNALNRVLGWHYFMGSSDDPLRGLPALAWGLVTTAPIPAPLVFLCTREERGPRVLPALLFTLFGGVSAVAFFSFGIRSAIETLGLGYALQESVIVILFALLLSVPAHLAAVLSMPGATHLGRAVLLSLLPAAAALLGLLLTLVVDRPVSEVLQLRGFVVGFVLRLAMFFALYAAFDRSLRRPDKNPLD
ncbi:MAG: hypothetical protein JW820_17140 [Spirochaetales bacterium]|nr:hypothetical protein [Spirochaetales bacterium]